MTSRGVDLSLGVEGLHQLDNPAAPLSAVSTSNLRQELNINLRAGLVPAGDEVMMPNNDDEVLGVVLLPQATQISCVF